MTDKIVKQSQGKIKRTAAQADSEMVAASLIQHFDEYIAEVKASTADSASGTNTKLQHLNSALNMRFKMVDALQSLGLIPKNLGSSTQTSYSYRAIVSEGGIVTTTDEDNIIRAELEEKFRGK